MGYLSMKENVDTDKNFTGCNIPPGICVFFFPNKPFFTSDYEYWIFKKTNSPIETGRIFQKCFLSNHSFAVLDENKDTVASSSPDSLVAEPASITLVKAFLEGRLQLLRAGDDSTNCFAGLLSLQEGQSVATSDGSVVEHYTCDMRGREEKKYRTKGAQPALFSYL